MINLPPTKPTTSRLATATGVLGFSNPQVHEAIRTASLEKGDVLAVARIAGINAAKQTSSLLPLCHNIPLSGVEVHIELVSPGQTKDHSGGALYIAATARTNGQTGVEMEALTAVTVAGLTAYDMCKSLDRGMVLEGVRVMWKEGGASGTWIDGEKVC